MQQAQGLIKLSKHGQARVASWQSLGVPQCSVVAQKSLG